MDFPPGFHIPEDNKKQIFSTMLKQKEVVLVPASVHRHVKQKI